MIAAAAPLCWFLNLSARQDTTTSSKIAVNVDAVQRARLNQLQTAALAKIVHDDRFKAE